MKMNGPMRKHMKMRKINSTTNSAKIVEAACWILIMFAVWSTIVRFVIIICPCLTQAWADSLFLLI